VVNIWSNLVKQHGANLGRQPIIAYNVAPVTNNARPQQLMMRHHRGGQALVKPGQSKSICLMCAPTHQNYPTLATLSARWVHSVGPQAPAEWSTSKTSQTWSVNTACVQRPTTHQSYPTPAALPARWVHSVGLQAPAEWSTSTTAPSPCLPLPALAACYACRQLKHDAKTNALRLQMELTIIPQTMLDQENPPMICARTAQLCKEMGGGRCCGSSHWLLV
jgi:hypothetical protein